MKVPEQAGGGKALTWGLSAPPSSQEVPPPTPMLRGPWLLTTGPATYLAVRNQSRSRSRLERAIFYPILITTYQVLLFLLLH